MSEGETTNVDDAGERRNVVACVVHDGDRRVLVGRRPARKRHGGLWEFPGGKVDDGESLAGAADREMREELGVRVVDADPHPRFVSDDPGSRFRILFLDVRIEGTPQALEHDVVEWVDPETTPLERYAPADRAFLEILIEERHGRMGRDVHAGPDDA
jgi:8-oxo-dGTP diphosphatase